MCMARWITFPRFITSKDGTRFSVRLYESQTRPSLKFLYREWERDILLPPGIDDLSSQRQVVISDEYGQRLAVTKHKEAYVQRARV